VKSLRKRRDKIRRKIRRRLSWRQKARRLQKQLGKKIGKRLDGLLDALTKQIKALHRDLAAVEREIEKLKAEQAAKSGPAAFVKWVESKVGVVEGSSEQREWADDLGYSWLLPWCSIFAATGLVEAGWPKSNLPTNPAYSGSWLSWSGGKRVGYSEAKPGDLLIFDWGDGGITDHVAVYVGNGIKVGGNENDRVERDAVPASAIVGVVRPAWK
jgi:hypothetical protein